MPHIGETLSDDVHLLQRTCAKSPNMANGTCTPKNIMRVREPNATVQPTLRVLGRRLLVCGAAKNKGYTGLAKL
jgi:hypothetical protein